MTDPIADMLTRIRNALVVKHETVEVPASNMKKEIARLLLQEGYINAYEFVEEGVQGKLVITKVSSIPYLRPLIFIVLFYVYTFSSCVEYYAFIAVPKVSGDKIFGNHGYLRI